MVEDFLHSGEEIPPPIHVGKGTRTSSCRERFFRLCESMHLDDLSENAAQNRYGDGSDDFTHPPAPNERGKALKDASYWEEWRIRSDSMFETL